MSGLTLRFIRVSEDRHRFEYRREDGTGEAIEMETAGLLAHDLLHYAVESEAGLRGSFFGILDKIGGYEELSVAGGAALGGEIAITDTVVGALRERLDEGDFDPDEVVASAAENLALFDQRPPRWLTAPMLDAARRRVLELRSDWSGLRPGEAMDLTFTT